KWRLKAVIDDGLGRNEWCRVEVIGGDSGCRKKWWLTVAKMIVIGNVQRRVVGNKVVVVEDDSWCKKNVLEVVAASEVYVVEDMENE
ncbi:hypothetical protein U1Q18_002398, partial [Sarracenia purpurea var. burkii]